MSSTEMKTTNPIGGLRLLYKANKLAIIAVILAILGGIILVIGAGLGLDAAADPAKEIAGPVLVATIGGVVTVVGAVLVIITSIMEIVAMIKVSAYHSGYKTALLLMVASFLFTVAVALINLPEATARFVNMVPPVLGLLKVWFIIGATTALLTAVGNTEMVAKGTSVRTIYMVCTVIMVAVELVSIVPMLSFAADLVSVVTSVVQLVALFKYIGFLGGAVKVFEA